MIFVTSRETWRVVIYWEMFCLQISFLFNNCCWWHSLMPSMWSSSLTRHFKLFLSTTPDIRSSKHNADAKPTCRKHYGFLNAEIFFFLIFLCNLSNYSMKVNKMSSLLYFVISGIHSILTDQKKAKMFPNFHSTCL